MKKVKRLLAVILTVIMLVAALPMTQAYAEEVYEELLVDVDHSVTVVDENVTLKFVPENDGCYAFTSKGSKDTYAMLFDSEFKEIGSDDDNGDDMNFLFNVTLKAGKVYYLRIGSYEMTQAVFDVVVTEIPGLVSGVIKSYPEDMTCIEGMEHSTADLTGLEIEYIDEDGEVISWSYLDGGTAGDYNVSYDLVLNDDKSAYIVIMCGGIYLTVDYTVVENPVESIEYTCDEDIKLYEESDGYYYNGVFYYEYSLPENSFITIHYKDGTSIQGVMDSVVDGMWIHGYDTQEEEPWGVGTHYYYIVYMGVETAVEVEVLASPFKSVTLNSAPTKEYVMSEFEYGYLDERNKYVFQPTDLTGLSLTVEYKDGTTQVFDDDDIDIENMTIGGYRYSIDECIASYPRTVEATLHLMGTEIKYDVQVVKSPLRKIEMTWYPDITDYEEGYDPIFNGAEFELLFSDGTTQTVVASDENTTYSKGGWPYCIITAGDYRIGICDVSYDYWERCYIIICLDKIIEYEGFSYFEGREISDVSIDGFTPDADGMILNVEYAEGYTEQIKCETVMFNENRAYSTGYAKTEFGILPFEIRNIYENNAIAGYEVNILFHNVLITGEVLSRGDVDKDGKVTVLDATAIQRYEAKLEELDEASLTAADTTKDGDVSILDATTIQLFVSKLIDKF